MEQWKEYRLGDFMEFNPKRSLSKNTIARKITMDKLVPHTRDIYDWTYEPYSGGAKFQNGDTLMARITPCLENGKQAYVSMLNNGETAFGSTEYIVICGREALCDNRFAYYLSLCPTFRNAAIKSMVGTSGRQRAQVDVLENMTMRLPPLSEQLKIVSILSSLDDKIELNRKINSNLEEQAKALFKSWFIDFEPFKDDKFVDSELGKIPEGWKVLSLDDIADYLNGLAMQKYRPATEEQTLPVLKIKELGQGYCDASCDKCSSKVPSQYIVNDGDVIFSWSGTLMVDLWCGGICGLNQHLFKVSSKDYPKWFYLMWTLEYLNRFIHIAKDKAVTMGHIKREELHKAKVVVPTTPIFNKANMLFAPIVDKMINTRISNRKLAAVRNALLPKLMSGEIDV